MNRDEIIHAKDLGRFNYSEILTVIEYSIDEMRETKTKKYSERIMELISYLKKVFIGKEGFPIIEIIESKYWSVLHEIQSNSNSEWNNEFRQKQLQILENIFYEYEEKVSPSLWNQICYSYSKALTNIGRVLEGISILEKMIENDDRFFQMKEPELGWGLIMLAALLTSEQERMYCIYNGYQKLKKFKKYVKDPLLQSFYHQPFLVAKKLYEDLNIQEAKIELGGNKFSGKEKIYRKWCAENTLFLNVANDIDVDTMIRMDSIYYDDHSFPNETNKYRSKFQQNFLNSLIQEFLSIRWLLFDSMQQSREKVHISDDKYLRENKRPNIYSFRTEMLKTVYRLSYSLFDKIAYFLNHYLNLNIDNYKTNFKTIWFVQEDIKKPLKNVFKNIKKMIH